MAEPSRNPAPTTDDPAIDLPALTPLPTAAERAAEVIREHIFAGKFLPGTQLPETTLARALQVSRNTVRDAFHMLVNDHLLAYEIHRGVTVRSLTADDLRDIYFLRRTLELSAIDRMAATGDGLDLGGLHQVVVAGEQARKAKRWQEVGTQNLHFHTQIVTAHDSPRADELFKRLMTELRLGFLAVPDAEALHGPYLQDNRQILKLLEAGRFTEAREMLKDYLQRAQDQLVAAVTDR